MSEYRWLVVPALSPPSSSSSLLSKLSIRGVIFRENECGRTKICSDFPAKYARISLCDSMRVHSHSRIYANSSRFDSWFPVHQLFSCTLFIYSLRNDSSFALSQKPVTFCKVQHTSELLLSFNFILRQIFSSLSIASQKRAQTINWRRQSNRNEIDNKF